MKYENYTHTTAVVYVSVHSTDSYSNLRYIFFSNFSISRSNWLFVFATVNWLANRLVAVSISQYIWMYNWIYRAIHQARSTPHFSIIWILRIPIFEILKYVLIIVFKYLIFFSVIKFRVHKNIRSMINDLEDMGLDELWSFENNST